MKTSVVLCAYNGEMFILDQLNSILNQSTLPDEIILVNDCSTDETHSILCNFIKKQKISCKYVVNESNMGVAYSFAKGIEYVSNDIIIFSDQDDIWMPNRVYRIKEEFSKYKKMEVFFSNGWLIDSESNLIKGSLFSSFGFDFFLRFLFKIGFCDFVLTKKFVVTGATMAVKTTFAKSFYKTKNNHLHDMFLSVLSSHLKTINFTNEKLIYYRIHQNQTVGVSSKKQTKNFLGHKIDLGKKYFDDLLFFDDIFNLLSNRFKLIPRFIETKKRHKMIRLGLKNKNIFNRLIIIHEELFNLNYFFFSYGLKSYLRDIIKP